MAGTLRPFALVLLAVAWVAPAWGQQPEAPGDLHTLSVSANGVAQAAPDTAVVQLDISSQNASLKNAYADAQARAEQVRALLQQQGIAPAQAEWSSYSVQPNFDYKANRVTGYTVAVGLSVNLTDFTRIGPLLDAFSGGGITALRGVSFELKHPGTAKAAAIADAYRQADEEAHALAAAAQSRILGLASATLDVSMPAPIQPVRYGALSMMAAAPAPTASFTPQSITVTAHVTAIYRIQP